MQAIILLLALAGSGVAAPAAALPAGDAEEGARQFRACAACHALEPGAHRTGPSLAGILGREAGTVPGFPRYSPALAASGITWTPTTLDAWLADPEALVPGNRMTFPGVREEQARADLIAYLERATAEGGAAEEEAAGPPMGGGMMGGEPVDLRVEVGPNNQITAIRHCGDTYTVEVESGEAHQFWEFNLRFKTDSSDKGPEAGRPVLIPAGMMGDRAFVVFAAPAEISPFVDERC